MTRDCDRCGDSFTSEDKRRKYCGVECYRKRQSEQPNSGCFARGLVPWNKHLKGIHLSPASEFKPGQTPVNHEPVGAVAIRQRKNRHDLPRAWVKVAEPNVWRLRAVIEWERTHGPLPRGKLVHHVDRNPLNDDPSNLLALTRAEHLAEHRHEFRRAS